MKLALAIIFFVPIFVVCLPLSFPEEAFASSPMEVPMIVMKWAKK
tara:strand:+ start:804 stop:938 length:135 start_codon:yes stop_codon:yes gene_type:complete